MPSSVNMNKINNARACRNEDMETEPRKFIRNRNYPKKDMKISKDAKSHKKDHQKRVDKRVQARIKAAKLELAKLEVEEKEEPIVYRIPEPKKIKVNSVVKRQPKRKAQENWNDQLDDVELGQTIDIKEKRDEAIRDDMDYYWSIEHPKELEDAHMQEYEEAKFEIDKMIAYFGSRVTDEMIRDPMKIVTRYEKRQYLNELKEGLTITLTEYEAKKATLNKIWTTYKEYQIPRHVFDDICKYEENKLKLEMCELEPIVDKKLRNKLKAKIHEWEDYIHQEQMDAYSALEEVDDQMLIQIIENSERLQNFVSNLQKNDE